MKRRFLVVALAVLLAVLGAAGVLAYVRQANARALAGVRTVSTLVAQSQIAAGTSADAALRDGLLRSERLPASAVPANAVRSLTAGLGSLVMSSQVQPGQLLLQPMLVPMAQVTGGVALPTGKIAVTIALCMPEAVAAAVSAGSQVEVFDTVVAKGSKASVTAGPNCQGPHQLQDYGQVRAKVLLAKVQVLAVGGGAISTAPTHSTAFTSASTDGPSQGNSVLVTLAVTQSQAQKVIATAEAGLPYLALLGH